jgi:oligoendopeptidase F
VTDAQEELSILETFLIGSTQVCVDITARFLFESRVFERRAAAELSAAELCQLMAQAQQETYGDALDPNHLHPYMWTWKPHYYSAGLHFYNYPYAFGLLFGLGLYARYQQQGADFLPHYKQLLASTGQARPAELAARFGIDIRTPAFWQSSLALIGQRIARYNQIA